MGYNFPNSPSMGQVFTPASGPTFVWNGVAWNAQTQGMPVTVYMSDTAPVSPAPGQLWWNSTTGNLSVFYADADSTQWVQVSGQVAAIVPGVFKISGGITTVAQATLDIALPSGYHALELNAQNITTTAAVATLTGNFSFDGGASYVTALTHYFTWDGTDTVSPGNWAQVAGINGGYLYIIPYLDPAGTNWIKMDLNRPSGALEYQSMMCRGFGWEGGTAGRSWRQIRSSGFTATNLGLSATHLRLSCTSGNLAAGLRWQLNGIR